MPADLLLRSAREASRLTQTEVAERAGTAQPDVSFIERGTRSPTTATLERLLSSARHTLIAIPTVGLDVATAGGLISTALKRWQFDSALRAFIDASDSLARESGANRVGLTLARPASTRHPVWDAALAGLATYWLDDQQLPVPDWTTEDVRFLQEPAELIEIRNAPRIDPDTVPHQFAARNVIVERGTLRSI